MKMILFNILIIGLILLIIAAIIIVGSPEIRAATQNNSSLIWDYIFRVTVFLLIVLGLSFLGSYFISGHALIPIKKAWQRQIEFTADASHELRTPLAAIQANLDVIKGNPTETVETQMIWLENIDFETARMAKLVEDLLTLSRSDSNISLLNKTNFMLDDVVCQAINSLKQSADIKELHIEAAIEPNTVFFGEKDKLQRLIIILLDNAIKYTPRNGNIYCGLKKVAGGVHLFVKDNGIGIDKDSVDRVFERFYRADKARDTSQGGNGLGLSIAKCIVQEHNGSIAVESKKGEGTRFDVKLPI